MVLKHQSVECGVFTVTNVEIDIEENEYAQRRHSLSLTTFSALQHNVLLTFFAIANLRNGFNVLDSNNFTNIQ